MHVAIGTDLFQILFTCAGLTIMQAVTNHTVDLVLALIVAAGSTIGAQIGARLGRLLRGEQLKIILAVIVLGVMVKMAVASCSPGRACCRRRKDIDVKPTRSAAWRCSSRCWRHRARSRRRRPRPDPAARAHRPRGGDALGGDHPADRGDRGAGRAGARRRAGRQHRGNLQPQGPGRPALDQLGPGARLGRPAALPGARARRRSTPPLAPRPSRRTQLDEAALERQMRLEPADDQADELRRQYLQLKVAEGNYLSIHGGVRMADEAAGRGHSPRSWPGPATRRPAPTGSRCTSAATAP